MSDATERGRILSHYYRETALEYFPKKLAQALLAMPEDCRLELLDSIDYLLCMLFAISEQGYVILETPPEDKRSDDPTTRPPDRQDLDSAIDHLRMFAALLDDEIEEKRARKRAKEAERERMAKALLGSRRPWE